MRKSVQTLLLFVVVVSCSNIEVKDDIPSTILIDAEYLSHKKKSAAARDPNVTPALDQLILEAESALLNAPYTVTDKERLPPSGNKHDYASYSRYWWPDTTQLDGLPYIRRDGVTNPASQDITASDRPRIGAFAADTETLGLAYYFTREDKYADKAAELLRVWFLDEDTRMNPNLNHAQCRPGHNDGSKSGILDGRLMISALEASLLILGSGALSQYELQALQAWANQYYKWLTSAQLAIAEAGSQNNHGSYYDVQTAYFALYAGNQIGASDIISPFYERRILSQIRPDGSMPQEMARTRPLFYSVYNMHAILCAAQLAKHIDVDIRKASDETSRLRIGLDTLVPYSSPERNWPSPTVDPMDRMDFFPILLMADLAYPNKDYKKWTKELDPERRQSHRANLAVPLMR